MIKKFGNFIILEKKELIFPSVRHLTSYESAISILENDFIISRNEMKKNIDFINQNIVENKKLNSKDIWWDERKESEINFFETEDLIYCSVDWLEKYANESGHGPVMIYFKPSIFENFKVTLTIEDSLHGINNKIFEKEDISKLYSDFINKKETKDVIKILNNINETNKGSYFNTSKGKIFIEEGRFYNKYSEIQIHTKKISIDYIKEIKLTNNYFDIKDSDSYNKRKLISICDKMQLKITQ